MSKFLRLASILLLLLSVSTVKAQHEFGNSRISGDFGFNGMYYIPDSIIGAEKVDSKVRANAFINLLYSNGGFSAGMRYEYYQFPLIDFEKIDYKGQGIKYFFADYKNKFIQVTAGNFYEQFGNGLTLRAYEDRQLGIDNSLLGARVKLTPYKGIYLKGVWGVERRNFDSYIGRKDFVRGADAEISFGEIFPVIQDKGFVARVGANIVSKFEKGSGDYIFNIYPGPDSTAEAYIPGDKIPENVLAWATRMTFGYKDFRLEAEYARKINDPNVSNFHIYKPGEALFLSATYAMKGFGVAASFIRADNMEFRSQRMEYSNSLLFINNQSFKTSIVKDNAGPQIITDSNLNWANELGEEITISQAKAYDVLSYVEYLSVTMTDSTGNKILDNADASKDYKVTLSKYGNYRIEYSSRDGNGRTSIRSFT